MRIGVIGPGALGCLFATRLFSASNEQDTVLLIDHKPDRAEYLNKRGILYETTNQTENIPVPVRHSAEDIAPLDVIFSCVKSYDLDRSLPYSTSLLHRSTLFIFLQNGISHLRFAGSNTIPAIVVFATSSEGATCLGAGHIRHAGSGQTWLGFPLAESKGAETKLQHIQALLQDSGLTSSISKDIQAKLWAKLFINVGINGLTVIHNCSNGQLLASSRIRDQLEKLVKEAEQVARAQKITLYDDPLQTALDVCTQTADNISSMLQDVRNKCHTEVDAINGNVSKIGRELNIPTPENDKLICQIKEIENTYSKKR